MKITESQLDRFIELKEKHCDVEEVSREEALKEARRLLGMMKVIYQPIDDNADETDH